MYNLYTHTLADSSKFPFDYSKQEERVLIVCGKAILTPDDGALPFFLFLRP